MTRDAPVSAELLASLEAQYAGVEVASALLAALRRHLALGALDYAEPPEPILGGTESWIFGFRLAGAPTAWQGPLVLRVARDDQPRLDLRFEAAVQRAVAGQGFPAPRVLALFDADAELGRPGLVMERIPGVAGPAGLFDRARSGPLALLLGAPRLLSRLPVLQARALLQLHALDPEPLRRELERSEVFARCSSLDARLAEIESDAIETGHAALRALAAWLVANRPPDTAPLSICHGDFHAFNLMFAPGRLTGVIDWTGARLADPHLDLGVVRAQLEISQLPVARVPTRVVRAVQMGILRCFEREYARTRPIDPVRLAYYEALPCASAVARMLRHGKDASREPLAELAWEHPHALARLERRVRAVTGIELSLG